MPFVTEELWQRLPNPGRSLAVEEFPQSHPELADAAAEKHVESIIEVIVKIRDIRRQMNVEPARRIQANLATSDPALQSVLADAVLYVQTLARCEQVNILPAIGVDDNSSRSVVAGVEIELPLAGLIDVSAERTRLEREIAKIEKELGPIQEKLSSPEFVKNAPAKVVQLNQSRVAEFQEKLTKLNENLRRIATL